MYNIKKIVLILIVLFGVQYSFSQELTVEAPKMDDGSKEDAIYNSAGIEVKPEFPGGIEKFYKFFAKNFQSPDDENFQGGKLFISFVVDKDGSLIDIKVIRDLGFGTANEALRVLKICPRWQPGEQNGKKVRCSYMLPVSLNSNIIEKK